MTYRNQQMVAIIDDYIHSERDRAILKRKLVDDITYDQLAQDFSLDDSTIKRIVKRHKKTIEEHL